MVNIRTLTTYNVLNQRPGSTWGVIDTLVTVQGIGTRCTLTWFFQGKNKISRSHSYRFYATSIYDTRSTGTTLYGIRDGTSHSKLESFMSDYVC